MISSTKWGMLLLLLYVICNHKLLNAADRPHGILIKTHEPTDSFGASVAISKDLVVVGSPGTLIGGHRGAAYVFAINQHEPTTPKQVAKLTVPGSSSDHFGASVAVDGDMVVVGAPGLPGSDVKAGTVYVFLKPSNGWGNLTSPTAILKSPRTAGGDAFGNSLSINDVTIVVGAPGQLLRHERGSVFVYTKPSSGWKSTSSPDIELVASDGEGGDGYGASVSIDDDKEAVVGAPYATVGGISEQGAIYVFNLGKTSGKRVHEDAKLTAKEKTVAHGRNSGLGSCVSISSGIIVAGAPGSTIDAQQSRGAFYFFVRPNGGWNAQAKQTYDILPNAFGGHAFQGLGTTLALNQEILAVGAPAHYPAPGPGSILVFKIPGEPNIPNLGWRRGTLSIKADWTLRESGPRTHDDLGDSVAVSGNLLVAGAPFAGSQSHKGIAFLYRMPR
jgi:hypothetical protein